MLKTPAKKHCQVDVLNSEQLCRIEEVYQEDNCQLLQQNFNKTTSGEENLKVKNIQKDDVITPNKNTKEESYYRTEEEIIALEKKVNKMPKCSEKTLFSLKITFLKMAKDKELILSYQEFMDSAFNCLEEEKLLTNDIKILFEKMLNLAKINAWSKIIKECVKKNPTFGRR